MSAPSDPNDSPERDENSGAAATDVPRERTARLVGSIVDPSVDETLSLPPAPSGKPFTGASDEHPVRARLLARSRGEDPDAPPPASFEATTSPDPTRTDEPVISPLLQYQEPRFISFEDAPSPPSNIAATPSSPTDAVPVAPADVAPQSTPAPEPPPPDLALELERIAGQSSVRLPGPRLSPHLTALLGGLVGLTVMGTLGIFLGRLRPEAAQTLEGAEVAAPAPTATEPVVEATPKRQRVPGPWLIEDDKGKEGVRILTGTIGKNPFLRAIQDAGLPKAEAYRAYAALKDVRNLDRCGSQDRFRALIDTSTKKLKAFEYVVSPEEIYQAKTGDDGLLHGKKLDLQVVRNQVRRAFAYDGKSFEESAKRAGFDPGLASVVEKALSGHMLLSELRAGDRMRVVVQEVTVLGEFARYAGVEAIELLRPGKKSERFYYYSHPSEGGYFDSNGRAPFEGGWRKPIPTAPVTSKFNMKRLHPVLKKIMPHNGTDFGAPTGTPIGATAPGVIAFIGPGGPSGNLVKVKHEGGYESGYAHLSRFVEGLKVGDSVDRMQLVGYCGTTGRSTGPHLHFTMKKDGQFIDAESLNLDGMRVLPPSQRAPFAIVREKYDPILDAITLPEPIVVAAPAAPAPVEMAPLAEEEIEPGGDNPMMAAPAAPTPAAPTPAAPAPAAPTPSALNPAAPPKPAAKTGGGNIFLSDGDLLKAQSASDTGEVDE